jgi:hypothetical protein
MAGPAFFFLEIPIQKNCQQQDHFMLKNRTGRWKAEHGSTPIFF